MAKKVVIDPSEVRKRGYKLLLYADNSDHMRILSRIRRSPDFKSFYVGCWHIVRDDNGSEIVHGRDKKHCHVILSFENPRYWSGVLSSLRASEQFCRPIDKGSIDGGYVYLIHANAPDKEQYTVDALWGAPEKVEAAKAAIIAYQQRHITLSDSLKAIRCWIVEQRGQRITPVRFIDWITKTPYIKAASNPWVRQMIDDHNYLVSQQNEGEFFVEQYKSWDDWLKERGFVSFD